MAIKDKSDKPDKPAGKTKPYAYGRVQFLAHLESIKADLRRGLPISQVRARHPDVKIGYPSFARLVERYAVDARQDANIAGVKNHERSKNQPSGGTDDKQHTATADPALIRKLTRG